LLVQERFAIGGWRIFNQIEDPLDIKGHTVQNSHQSKISLIPHPFSKRCKPKKAQSGEKEITEWYIFNVNKEEIKKH